MSAPDNKIVGECLALVAPAENAFRSRWRLSTLARANPGLHEALSEQIDLFNQALVTGTRDDARTQAEAMVRGWRAACAALESPLLPDDAYMTGFDPHTGTRVVISDVLGTIARVQGAPSERVVMVTPDEVARLLGASAILAECKSLFPDAEIVGATPPPHSERI